MDLSAYDLQPLREDRDFVLYRASQPGQRSVLALVARDAKNVARLEHEYGLASILDPAWAARPLALDRHPGPAALILEDAAGDPLGSTGRPTDLARFLLLAVNLVTAVGQVHGRGLIHKDVKPANVLVDAAGNIRLTGFGVASRLPRERHRALSPETIVGTFAYLAPEQTGRMNRSVDTRSDLYALGVTLYEMLTGALPFSASDPMEWIHCHIARKPAPPGERLRGIPAPVEAIILKLLAKNAEDRYQTAAGVKADLERCLASWEQHRRIDAFPLGGRDVSDVLRIPERLYGRERQVSTLRDAFDRVVASGIPELVLVSGYSGIGKSSIVNELHQAIVPRRALYAAAKFDQYRRGIPYATLAQAFRNLVRELLSKNDAELAQWRDRLLAALGPNGGLMVGLIPELAVIIGDQPPVPDLPAQDRQHRFQQVFRRFLGVFARAEHPLALFLDDLQWLDNATIDLIAHVATHSETRHLLLVGAYRDNEVGPDHPLTRMLATIREGGAAVGEIVVAPLAPRDVERLLADALHAAPDEVRPLAALVFEKTGGNPFFTIQFLTALLDQDLLRFDRAGRGWTWALDGIRARAFTDNVADLMAAKLARLSPATREALGQLACLGHVADANLLAPALGGAEEAVHSALWEAVHSGLVHRSERSYEFLHDRVHEAAYALIDGPARATAHLRIGRLLVAHTPSEEVEAKLFDIVNQYARGVALIENREEREAVAGLNLRAGLRAKAASAYASARQYFAAGRALLGAEAWVRCPRLCFDLELNLSECEYVTGDFATAEQRLAQLSARAADNLDSAAVTRVQIYLHTNRDQSSRAVAAGLDYLRRADPRWAWQPAADHVRPEYDAFMRRLESGAADAVLTQPLMRDPDLLATMDVLTALCSPAQFTDLDLFRLIVVRMASLSLLHGASDATPFAFTLLGGIVRTTRSDAEAGSRLGRVALDLIEQRGLTRQSARAYSVFAVHVAPWTQHLSTCRVYLQRSFDAARDAGDLTCAAYARVDLVTNLLATAAPLEEVEREAESALAFVEGARFGLISDVIVAQLRLIATLRGKTPVFGSFDDAGFDEDHFEHRLEGDPQLAVAASRYWIRKLQARVFAEDYAAAIAIDAKSAALLWTLPTQVELPEYRFYAGLAHAGRCDTTTGAERARHLEELQGHHRQFVAWAESGRENFEHRAALLGAELARLERRELDAMRLYEEAIHGARAHGFVQNEGLAHERASRFYEARGFATIAVAYMQGAVSCYALWGADGKVRHLSGRGTQLRPSRPHANGTISTSTEQLDLATIVKMSQAISGQIEMGSLVETLMVAALEHAGAERGLLVLPHGQDWHVEAEAKTAGDRIAVRLHQMPVSASALPESILRFVARSRESVLLDDAQQPNPYEGDEYLKRNACRSILCLPLVKQARLSGILYLENALAAAVFTPTRVAVLRLLASQAAISLENARLYADLQRAEIYLSEAQRLSHTGSFGWTPETGEIFWSEQTFRIFDYEPTADPTVDMVLRRTHPDDVALVEREIERVLREKGGLDFEHRLLMPDGSVKHLRVVAHPGADDRGGFRLAGAIIDQSESVRTQALLQRLQSDFAHAARISTLGELTVSIAHELNQPIAAVIINGQTGLRRIDHPSPDLEKIRVTTARVVRDAQRAADIIARIRAMAIRRVPQPEPLSLRDLIEESLVFLRHEIQSFGVSVLQDDSAGPAKVRADRVQLQQVIVNLVVNAMQAMAQTESAGRKVTIRTTRPDAFTLRCAVEDSGPGIDPGHLDRLFDSFFTTKSQGLGIGLRVCRSIVEAHGGQIAADNASAHGGARFYVTLPLAGEEPVGG